MNAHISQRPDKGLMIVEDLSRGGLAFRTETRHSLRVKDIIRVKFKLDDEKRSEISQRAEVKRVDDYSVGAAFLDLDAYSESNRVLGFYLMPR